MRRVLAIVAASLFVTACAGTDDPSGGSGGSAGSGPGSGGSSAGGGSPTGGGGPGSGGASSSGGGGGASSSSSSSGSGGGGGVVPALGGSSGGTGGPAPVNGSTEQSGGISYFLIVPSSYVPGTPTPLLVVFSGTEGGAQMTQNLISVGPSAGTSGFIEAVLDGVTYNGDGAAGATVLDAVRAAYDVDNDRTYLLGESAGTSAAEQLGFHLRESWFAAYWANDVNNADGPATPASTLGFAPWGQVGPGGQVAIADQIVAAMQAAGYQLPSPAPYAGPGAGTHGDPNQFIAAVSWFPGKSRN